MIDVMIIVNILLIALSVEAITEILTTSEIMRPLRLGIKKLAYINPPRENLQTCIFTWVDKLISCGYCSSVWISFFVCIWLDYRIVEDKYINLFIVTVAIHRLSNWIHVLYELIRKGRINSVEIALSLEDKYGTDGESFVEGATEA